MTAPFQFKQFRVQQDLCAMKVGTDGILLGAWAELDSPKSILDIGAGSGLIALMLAQRFPPATITAIEIAEESAKQARHNFAASLWSNRMELVHGDVCDFQAAQAFDLIVANPPYFEHSLRPQSTGRRTARHTDTLSHAELVSVVDRLLAADGQFAVVLPTESRPSFNQLCEQHGLHCVRQCDIRPTPHAAAKRVLLQFGRNSIDGCDSEALVVELSRHEYSPAFKKLTRDFYLKH